MITQIHNESRATYGSPRIHAELKAAGEAVGEKRVARKMSEADISGVSRRTTPPTTTSSKKNRSLLDLVDREFEADEPNELWIADITYIPTEAGYMYLAVVLDVYRRRVIGWATTPAHSTRRRGA
jgi:putative transposase